MQFIIVIIIVFIVVSIINKKNKEMKEKQNELIEELKAKKNREVQDAELSLKDKLILERTLNKSIKNIKLLNDDSKEYIFRFSKNQILIERKNEDFDVVIFGIKKIKIGKRELFETKISAWVIEKEFEDGIEPDVLLENIISTKKSFKSTINDSIIDLFKETKSEIRNKRKIEIH